MNALTGLDPNTPVLVGVGQAADPIGSPRYHRWSAVDLAAQAAATAMQDAGIASSLIDTVVGVRQFEISTPSDVAPLGRSDNYPRSVAERVGAQPRRAVLEVTGGQGPQHLVTEFAKSIAAGNSRAVLLVGSEAISTTRAWVGRADALDFTEHVGGGLEDRGYGLDGLLNPYEVAHGLGAAPPTYALLENARRHREGLDRKQYAARIGELFAPFTRVAARNPYAAAPVERSADELVTITERNRLIADPYPRFVVSRDQVNQGAAVVITSVETARAAGISEDRWVFLHGYSDLHERSVLERPDLSRGPASIRSASTAIARSGITPDDISVFDLYSCFPIPVFNICDGLDIEPTDPRGLTVTGGLPFFGGAGNNYSMHAIAEVASACRARPGIRGFVGANGGFMTKYSAGVYSTEPARFETWDDTEDQATLDAVPPAKFTESYNGRAVVETFTVATAADRSWAGIVVGRTADGTRILATTAQNDDAAWAVLTGEQPIGASFSVSSDGTRNTAEHFRTS